MLQDVLHAGLRLLLAQQAQEDFALQLNQVVLMMKDGGSIVLMSSAVARTGLKNHEAIAAAKAGVVGLARAAAATYAGRGVRVNAVAPGLVDTPMPPGSTSTPVKAVD